MIFSNSFASNKISNNTIEITKIKGGFNITSMVVEALKGRGGCALHLGRDLGTVIKAGGAATAVVARR